MRGRIGLPWLLILLWLLGCFAVLLSEAITFGRIVRRSQSPSTALIHATNRVRVARGVRRRNLYCTGSLISRQVAITAGHCLAGKNGSRIQIHFIDNHKLLIFRFVKTFRILKEKNGVDIALMLLDRPVPVCSPLGGHSAVAVARLPVETLFDNRALSSAVIEHASCHLFGYGKSESHSSRIDYRMRAMPVRLREVRAPTFRARLTQRQKICEGDSGGPVVCRINGVDYTLGLSTTVEATATTSERQLCDLKTDDNQFVLITGAKFYDLRDGLPKILQFLARHHQYSAFVDDYRRCFAVKL